MITMVDELYDRQFQAGRADLFNGMERGVARLAQTVVSGFATLQRIQFDAPWVSKNKDTGCA